MASSEAQAVLDRMTGLNANETFAIEQFVDALVASGDWAHVYDVWSFALNATDYLTGWKTNSFTPNGNVSHASGTGVTLDDASSYLSLAVGPEDLRTWDGTGTSAGGWCLVATTGSNADYFGSISGGGSEWYFRNRTANDVQAILGSSAGATPRLAGITHPLTDFYYARNTGSARYIRVGDATTSGADAITTPWASDPIHFPGRNSSGNQNGFASTHDFFFIGNGNLDDQAMKDAIVQFRLDLVNGPPLPPADNIIPYHPMRKYSVRPNRFRLAPDHPLSRECVFAGLGNVAKSRRYHDSSSSGNDGALGSSTIWSVYDGVQYPVFNGTASSDITIDQIELGINNNSWTMAAWVYIDPTHSATADAGIAGDITTANTQWWMDYLSGPTWRNGIAVDGIIRYSAVQVDYRGQWVHVAWRADRDANNTTSFVDGVADAPTILIPNPAIKYIGAFGKVLDGGIRDLILHRRALTDSEISSLADSHNLMLDGWVQPLPTLTYSFPTEEPTPPPTGNVVVYHPMRKYSVRPARFRLAPDHPLSKGCTFAGLGQLSKSKTNVDTAVHQRHGDFVNMDSSNWSVELNRPIINMDGSTEYVLHPNVLNPVDAAGTVAVWGYSNNAAIWARLISITDGITNFQVAQQPNGNIGAIVFSGSANLNGPSAGCSGEWAHYTFVNSAPGYNNITGYRNGLTGTAVGVDFASTYLGSVNMYIGQRGNGTYWNGKLADVCVWSRELSPSEFAPLYNPNDPMLDGWVQPLPTITYSFGEEAPTPPTGRIHKLFRSSLIRGLRC